MKNSKKIIQVGVIFLVFVVGIILRFLYLDRIPGGLSDDELDYVLTAQSIFYSGKTLEGTFSPYSFQPAPSDAKLPYARAPYMLLAPFAGLTHYGLMGAKIPYAVISVMGILIVMAIAWRLLGKRIALYTLFVLSFNPWSIYFGRTAFDTPLAVFFAYVFICCLLYLKNWWILLSYIPWLIGLYSYQGTIVLYPLLLIIGSYGIWRLRKGEYTRHYQMVALLGLISFFLFMLSLGKDRAGTRIGEIAYPDNQVIISRVNDYRRKAVQSGINSFFINRVTVSAWQVLGQYIGAFSTKHLFVSGEERSTFSLWTHGLFYPVEIIFLIIGIFYVYYRQKNIALFLLSIVIISPIPAAISVVGASYALRASFMYPIFCIFIATGIESLRPDRKSHWPLSVGIMIAYIILIANFTHVYFIRNPVNNSEGFGFSNRILAKYIQLASSNQSNVLYIGNNVLNTFRQYIFYNTILNNNSIYTIQKSIRNHEYSINRAAFIECPDETPGNIQDAILITPAGKPCFSLSSYKEEKKPIIIAQLDDSGRIYEIYNDSVCKDVILSEYQPMISFKDLNVEKMSSQKFCETYISQPK